MARQGCMSQRMPTRRTIATSDMAALSTTPEVEPPTIRGGQALHTSGTAWPRCEIDTLFQFPHVISPSAARSLFQSISWIFVTIGKAPGPNLRARWNMFRVTAAEDDLDSGLSFL